MTIDRAVTWLILSLLLLGVGGIAAGVLQIRAARGLRYFLLRKERITAGWRWLGLGAAVFVCGLLASRFGRQAAYRLVPPTPSLTPSPTITLTPSITFTPTITGTPTITPTGTITPTSTITTTPVLPEEISLLVRETAVPPEGAAFSEIVFARQLGRENQPLSPEEDFENPVNRIYGAFSYNNLIDGMRWTAIWYFESEVKCLETQLWDGGTGGYGYTECALEPWVPGSYEVRIFFGEQWMVSGRFEVLGEPLTATPSPSPSA